MAKAILVIDEMPNDCYECNFAIDLCHGTIPPQEYYNKRPSWCPLKPMPEKLHVEVNRIEDLMPSEFDIDKLSLKIRLDTDKLFALGWNACLKEIENG